MKMFHSCRPLLGQDASHQALAEEDVGGLHRGVSLFFSLPEGVTLVFVVVLLLLL